MNDPTEKPGQSNDQPQEQRQDKRVRVKPGFDKEQIPQGGPSDNGPMTAPEDDER